jgi:hypothetical protein
MTDSKTSQEGAAQALLQAAANLGYPQSDVHAMYQIYVATGYSVTEPTVTTSVTLTAALDAGGNLTVTDKDGSKDNNLTVSVTGGNLTIADAHEQFESAPAGWTLAPTGRAISIPVASFTKSITLNTAGGNDTVTVSFAGGSPLAGGLSYDGGTGSDKLWAKGSGTQNATYTPDATTTGDGKVVVEGKTITFAGLEPVNVSGMATATVQLPGADDVLTLSQGNSDVSAGQPTLLVSGTSAGTTIENVNLFKNTTVVVDTAAGGADGNDTVNIARVENDHGNTNLTVNTGSGKGDRVHVIGTVTFAGKTTLNSPRVDLDADVTGTVAVPRGLTLTGAGSDRVSVGGLDLTNLTGTLTVTGLRVTGATALAGTNVGGSTTLTDVVLSAAGVGAVAFAPGSSLTVNTGAGADTVGVAPGSKTTAVTWNGGQSVAVSGLGTLTLNGGDGGDTFNVGMPPAGQIGKLNLNGEAPDVAPGDTLNLSLAGTVNPTYSGTASGTAAATGFAAVAWAGIEAFPVPAGLGGTFDFQPDDPAHSVQPGSTMVTPSTAYTAAQGYGWTQAPRYGYDGGSQNVLSGSPLAGLLQDGVLGFSGMSSAAVFRVDVVSNNPFQIAAYLGDVLGARDKIEVAYSTNGDAASPTYTPITPAGGLSLPQGQFTAVSSATLFPGGVVPGVAGKALSVWVRIAELGGTPPGWTLSGLDVRPRTPVADLAVTPPATSTLPADSAVVDTFQVTGAPPGAVLTVATSLGAVESADARPELVGSQVIAGADGTAVVGIRRPSAGGTANVTVTEFAGGGSGSASQDYAVSLVQTGAGARVRSGTLSGPDADTFDRASVAFDQDVRVSTFTADDVVITLPDGTTLDNASANLQVSVAAAGATAGNARVFTVTFAGQTAVGTYTVKIGPNILNVDGNPMDQDGDGTAGETNGNDTFVATQHLPATDPSGAKVIAGAAVGSGGGSLDKLTVTFDRAVDPATFTPNDVVITGPGGTIAATQVAPADASNTVFDVAFPEQSAVGAYTFVVGPQILDATSGQPMNQNGNNANGEIPDDQFTLPTSIGDSGGPTGPGPTITAVSYPRDTPDVLDEIRVTFSEPLLESTLTSDDLRLTGPGGAAIDVSGATVAVVPDAPNTYLYTLATPLTVLGTYQVVIGPNVTDQDRVGMAQAFEGTVRVRQKSVLAVGGSDGSLSVVDPTNGDVLVRGRPLDGPNGVKYTGIVSQAIGDINGDSLADLLVAAASPLGENGVTEAIAGKIFVFDGADLANVRDGRLPAPSETLVPFATTDSIDPATGQRVTTGAYANGLNIALGDVNGDGSLDILVGTRGGVMDAAATAAGAPAAVGKFEIGRLAVLDGETGARIGADVFPFSDAYTKGVVPTAADLDGDGGQEVLVTRGGPVATEGLSPARARAKAAIKVQGYDLVNGQWQNLNLGANLRPTAGDGADFAWAPFDDLGPGVDPSTPVIARDGRLAAVGLPGGKQGVVFTAEADPNQATDFDSNIYGLTFTSTIGGQVTILSTGANGPTSGAYLISSAANDHATSSVDVDADGAGDVAVALETVMPQIVLLDPLTGQQRSTFAFPVTPNGVTLYGY